MLVCVGAVPFLAFASWVLRLLMLVGIDSADFLSGEWRFKNESGDQKTGLTYSHNRDKKFVIS